MDSRSKLKPIQGITLLFLLLVIPVGIYFYQTQNVGETRSQARGDSPDEPPYTIRPPKPPQSPSTPLATKTPTQTPTPTKTLVEKCNLACTSDTTCGEGMVCAQVAGVGKCRNAQCYGAESCWCYAVASPTPAPSCNSSCGTDVDCGTSMICVKTGSGNKCRNPACYGTEDCLCYTTQATPTPTVHNTPTPTEEDFYAPIRVVTKKTPTPTPTIPAMLLAELMAPSPTPLPITESLAAPTLTIDPFYNAKKQTNPAISLSGTSDPNAELDISITPDGIVTTVTADSLGNWQYTIPKKLTNGDKQLTILARTEKGGQMTKTETFKVVGGFRFPVAGVVFSLLIALGVGGYVLYQKKMGARSAPPAEPASPDAGSPQLGEASQGGPASPDAGSPQLGEASQGGPASPTTTPEFQPPEPIPPTQDQTAETPTSPDQPPPITSEMNQPPQPVVDDTTQTEST